MSQSTSVKGPGVLELVNKTLKLPTIPTVLLKLNEVVNHPDSSVDDVAKIISTDPAISTNLLRIVNSAYYGLQVRVSSINLAVSIMGFNMTRKIALKAAVFSVFGKKRDPIPQFEPQLFWAHSIHAGVAAKVLGEASPYFSNMHPEDLYICGLLHDIGKIILYENAPEDFQAALELAQKKGMTQVKGEEEVFGFRHSDVGSVLAIKWFLPEDLTIAIRYHHNPEDDPFHKSLSCLIHMANWLTWKQGVASAKGTSPPEMNEAFFSQIGIDPDHLEELEEKVKEGVAGAEDAY